MSRWGVASPLALPAAYNPTGDVACPAATRTVIIAAAGVVAQDVGNYYPFLVCSLAILLGATPPTALSIDFGIGAGSAVDTYTLPPAILVANATVIPHFALVGANSATQWTNPGATINVNLTPTGQAVTLKQVGSRAVVALFRGPDA